MNSEKSTPLLGGDGYQDSAGDLLRDLFALARSAASIPKYPIASYSGASIKDLDTCAPDLRSTAYRAFDIALNIHSNGLNSQKCAAEMFANAQLHPSLTEKIPNRKPGILLTAQFNSKRTLEIFWFPLQRPDTDPSDVKPMSFLSLSRGNSQDHDNGIDFVRVPLPASYIPYERPAENCLMRFTKDEYVGFPAVKENGYTHIPSQHVACNALTEVLASFVATLSLTNRVEIGYWPVYHDSQLAIQSPKDRVENKLIKMKESSEVNLLASQSRSVLVLSKIGVKVNESLDDLAKEANSKKMTTTQLLSQRTGKRVTSVQVEAARVALAQLRDFECTHDTNLEALKTLSQMNQFAPPGM